MIPAGHRLALVVAGTDRNLIDPPADTPSLALHLSRAFARVPLTRAAAAIARASAGAHAGASAAAESTGVRDPRTAAPSGGKPVIRAACPGTGR
ncbi:hypothetical protein [Streptomyces sp. NPDC047706]|uniref:hypothetical protein n=1 Tax=Streptomyces sp. NPDC047706 TaxID=3365486 RepID=UPI003718072D